MELFYPEIRKYYPNLKDGSLQPGYAGIRPKLSGPGQSPIDFIIQVISCTLLIAELKYSSFYKKCILESFNEECSLTRSGATYSYNCCSILLSY